MVMRVALGACPLPLVPFFILPLTVPDVLVLMIGVVYDTALIWSWLVVWIMVGLRGVVDNTMLLFLQHRLRLVIHRGGQV
jgi:hypothetical protein